MSEGNTGNSSGQNACFGATAAAGENVRAKEKGIGKREVCERGNSVATTARNSMRDTALANSIVRTHVQRILTT